MARWLLLVTCFLSQLLLCGAATDEELEDAKEELIRLWGEQKYTLIALDSAEAISFNVTYLGLLDLSVEEMRAKISVDLLMNWQDTRIAWTDSCKNASLNLTVCELDFIYTGDFGVYVPRIMLLTGFDGAEIIFNNEGETEIRVHKDGRITLQKGVTFDVFCPITLTLFPFDHQLCSVVLVPQNAFIKGPQVDHLVMTLNDPTELVIDSNEWDLVTYTIEQVKDGVNLTFEYKRLEYHKMYYLFVPAAVISMLSILQGAIQFDQKQRIVYAITTFLSMSVYLSILVDSLPPNGRKLPLLGRYFLVQALISALQLAATIMCARLLDDFERGDIELFEDQHGHGTSGHHEHNADEPSETIFYIAMVLAAINFDCASYREIKARMNTVFPDAAGSLPTHNPQHNQHTHADQHLLPPHPAADPAHQTDPAHHLAIDNNNHTHQPNSHSTPPRRHITRQILLCFIVEKFDAICGKGFFCVYIFTTLQTFAGAAL